MIRAIDKWLAGYLLSILRRPRVTGQRHLIFCVADHFEPHRGGADKATARKRLEAWLDAYALTVAGVRDADGEMPRHTFFYPADEYEPDSVAALALLCRRTKGEIEIHLHHRNDTAQGLRRRLNLFADVLRHEHGCLGAWPDGRTAYGFVHGNWALCNSRPDRDWCGVNEELAILSSTGCYADFTFPSAPSPTQTRQVNRIYRATDIPGRPRSADHGVEVAVRGSPAVRDPSRLMLITGPLAIDCRRRKWGILPRLENGELTGANPPIPSRIDSWVRRHIHVRGRPDWIFVKVHTHGCVEANTAVLLGAPMRRAREYLQDAYNDGTAWKLHYASAREMYNMVRAAEDGMRGEPGEYRDYEVQP